MDKDVVISKALELLGDDNSELREHAEAYLKQLPATSQLVYNMNHVWWVRNRLAAVLRIQIC